MKKNILVLILVCAAKATFAQTWNSNYQPPLSYVTPCDSPLILYSSNPSDLWQSGNNSSKNFFGLNGSESAIMTDSVNSYAPDNYSYFDILLTWGNYQCVGNVEVRFLHKMESDSGKDGGFVTYSNDNRATWHSFYDNYYNVGFLFVGFQNLYYPQDSIESSGGFAAFSGAIDTFIETRLEFISYLPVKMAAENKMMGADSIWVRFNFVSDSIESNKAGWIIKNLEAVGLYLGSNVEEVNDPSHEVLVTGDHSSQLIFETKATSGFESICIYDLLGRKVFEKSSIHTSTCAFDLSSISRSIYLYSVRFDDGFLVNGKLIAE